MRRPASHSQPVLPSAATPARVPSRVPVWLLAALLGLVTLGVYWQVVRYDFVNFDDPFYVTENPHVQGGLGWDDVKWAFTTMHTANWHPLTWLSLMLDCQFFGLNAGADHLINVFFHAANAVLLFMLLLRLMSLRHGDSQPSRGSASGAQKTANAAATATAPRAGVLWPSAVIAALFAWHPLHVESVAWIAERKDVLSAFFALLTLLAYVRYAQKQSRAGGRGSSDTSGGGASSLSRSAAIPASRLVSSLAPPNPIAAVSDAEDGSPALDPRRWTLDYSFALFFFACGLMAKPMLVTLPFVFLLLDYWPLNRIRNSEFGIRNFRSLIREKWPFFVLTAASCVVTFIAQKQGGAVASLATNSLPGRLGNAAVAYVQYLCQTVYPVNLAVIYPLPKEIPWGEVAGAIVVLAVICGLVWRARRQCPYLLVGWLWYLGMLVPVIGLVQVGTQALADRYTYLPLIGVFLGVTFWVADLAERSRPRSIIVIPVTVVVLGGCLVATARQLRYWRDSERLYQHTLAITENNYLAHSNLGAALGEKGQITEAISQFQEAIRLQPDFPDARYDLGVALGKQGRTAEAIGQFREVIRLIPDYADAHDNLGSALEKESQIAEAISQFQEAIRLKPDFADAHYDLGTALEKEGQIAEAISQFQEAIRLKPDYADAHYDLGTALDKQGQIAEAISQFQEAIRLKPDDADAHNDLGVALGEKGQIAEAISQFQEAIRLKPEDADAHNNLGYALDKEGQIAGAISQFQEAVRLKPNFFDALNNLGNAFVTLGRFDEAVDSYRQAIQVNSNSPEPFIHLGLALYQLGRGREAVAQYQEALRLNPNLVEALNNLAWLLATSSDAELRNGAEAVRLAERACELTHYSQPFPVGTLAAACGEAGRFPEAVAAAEKAEELATNAGLTALAAKQRQLLELYRAGKAYHESATMKQ